MELVVMKDEVPGTRYYPKDPDNEDHRKMSNQITKQFTSFDEMYDRSEKIAQKIVKKQYCPNSVKKKKPKEFREWRRDFIRETDGD